MMDQFMTADVHPARLIDTGLNSFVALRPGRDGDGPTGAQESARWASRRWPTPTTRMISCVSAIS